MKIELYLGETLVEINQDIDFVLNKQYTELSDLTSIIVDYSKTIKVPMTPRNNELFNYIYKLEHRVLVGQDIINYDPSQKIPMYMTFNGSMVMEGYAVLNSIDLKSKVYEVNLYGQLGKIFSILKEKNLSGYSQDTSGFWKEIVMNTKTVYDSFANDHHNLGWSSSDWTNFFGFAPQLIGKTDLFDTTGYETYGNSGQITPFTDVITATRGQGYEAYVKDGLDFNAYNELRTYMTRPYVYVDKLVQLVQQEINNGDYDGYTMSLNADWFNSDNPWYYNMVYFPGEESVVDNGDGVNGNVAWTVSQKGTSTTSFTPPVSSSNLDGYTYSVSGSVITISGDGTPSLTINCDGLTFETRATNCSPGSSWTADGKWGYYHSSDDNMSTVRIPHLDIYDGNDVLQYKLYLCDDTVNVMSDEGFLTFTWWSIPNAWTRLKSLGHKVVVPTACTGRNSISSSTTCKYTQVFNFGRISLNTSSFKFYFNCDEIDLREGRMISENCGFNAEAFLHPFKNDKFKSKTWNTNSAFSGYYTNPSQMDITSNTYRSMSRWTVKDILGNDFNPFKWLIDYAKKFRLAFDIDYATKNIDLKGGYFDTVTYKEVTVDYDQPVVIEPIVDKYRKVVFGYKDNKSRKGVQYLKNYGVDYGDIEIYTDIEVNNDTMELNTDKEESVFIPNKLDCLTWQVLNSNYTIKYGNGLFTNRMINTLDKEGKIQYFPFFAFRWTNTRNPYQQNVPFYALSDDTPSQKLAGKYTYLNGSGWLSEVEGTQDGNNFYYELQLPFIPQFDNYIPKTENSQTVLYWSTFAVPAETYNGSIPTNMTMHAVIDRWTRYLNEIFNINNKKVTCYIRMSYPEFMDFKFNKLFVIDNNVFLVNRIIDFNPNSEAPTKVELIQITDVTNLS